MAYIGFHYRHIRRGDRSASVHIFAEVPVTNRLANGNRAVNSSDVALTKSKVTLSSRR